MTLLAAGAVDASVVLALGLTAAALLRRRCAAWRHWVLAITIVCAAAAPALELLVPAFDLPLPAWSTPAMTSGLAWSTRPRPVASGSPAVPENRATAGLLPRLPDIRAAVAAVWLAGVLIGLSTLVVGLWRLARVGREARAVTDGSWSRIADEAVLWHGVRRPVLLLHGMHPALVATWGLRRPRVLLPMGAHAWSDERLRIVLFHEIAHVRRADWALLIAAAVLRCVYWFNPLAWIAERRLRHASEHACDDAVLEAGVSGADYATHLLALANDTVRLSHRWTPAAAMAHPSTLEERILAMLNATTDRQPLSASVRALTTAAVAAATLAIAGAAVSATTGDAGTVAGAGAAKTPIAGEAAAVRATGAAAAQSGPGVITGTLFDQLGGLLPGADVALMHEATGGSYAASTDATGSFEFRGLPTGEYALSTRLPGFSTVRTVIDVADGDVISRSLTLPVGSLEETITVTGERGFTGGATPERPRATEPRGARFASAPPRPRTTAVFTGGIGGQITAPRQLRKANPVYPASAQAGGVTGNVVLVGRIGIDGYLVDLREAKEGDAPAELVEAATDAVRQWAYSPTLLNGVPVEVNVTMNIWFTLQ